MPIALRGLNGKISENHQTVKIWGGCSFVWNIDIHCYTLVHFNFTLLQRKQPQQYAEQNTGQHH